MAGYCRNARCTQLPLEYEASFEAVERNPAAERQIPLRWVTAWIAGLSAISLGLGSALKWLLQ